MPLVRVCSVALDVLDSYPACDLHARDIPLRKSAMLGHADTHHHSGKETLCAPAVAELQDQDDVVHAPAS